MWAKTIVVLALTTTVRINGLQNDPVTGYNYDHPYEGSSSTIKASLAYYVRIPANHSPEDHFHRILSTANQFKQIPIDYSRVPPQDLGGYSMHRNVAQSSVITSNHIQQQIEPRNHPQSIGQNSNEYKNNPQHQVEHSSRNNLKNPIQTYRHASIPYTQHVTSGPPPLERISTSKHNRIVPYMASLPMSFNALLPFPIGVVPIKFRPFPLKTHLRQSGLLPLTSYQALESYKK